MKYCSQWQRVSCPWILFKDSNGIANAPWKIFFTTLLHTREIWSVTKMNGVYAGKLMEFAAQNNVHCHRSTHSHCHAQRHPQPVVSEVCSDILRCRIPKYFPDLVEGMHSPYFQDNIISTGHYLLFAQRLQVADQRLLYHEINYFLGFPG